MPCKLRRLQGWAPRFRGLRQERRPSRIGREARGRGSLLIAAGDVDGEQSGPRTAARIAKEHDHAPVRRPGRALVVEALGQEPLAPPVGLHDADRKLALILLGEGDVVTARRPDRSRIDSLAEADALRAAAARTHDVDLRMPATI